MRGRVSGVSHELSEHDLRAWAGLASRAAEPNPFHEPDCVVAAARHLPDGEDIRLAVVEDGDQFVACLPFKYVQYGRRYVPGMSYQTVTTCVRRMNYLGTPLIDSAGGLERTVKLLETVAEECRSNDAYAAEVWDVAAGGAVDGYLHEAAASLGLPLVLVDTFDRGILRRGEDAEGEELRSAPTMRDLRKKRRRLARVLGADIALIDRSDDAAIDEYIELESSGYKSEMGVAMTMFPGERDFFTEMCRSFAAQGRLHLYSLMAESTTTAMAGLVDAGDSIFLFKASYDASFAKYSPGLQIHAATIEHFRNETNAAMLDSCTGKRNQFIATMYPSRRIINRYCLVVQNRLRDRMRVKFVDGAKDVRNALKGLGHSRERRPPRGFRAAGT